MIKQAIALILIGIWLISAVMVNIQQDDKISKLEDEIKYLQEGYEDMDRSLDCVIVYDGRIKDKGCLLPNGIWEQFN